MRSKLAALGLALGLAGCATARGPSTILVPCQVPEVAKPAFPFDSVTPDADIFTKVQSLLSDRRTRQGYEHELEAAAKACHK